MSQLMISLDKNIFNFDSAAARRMIEYGEKNELFIVIPDNDKRYLDLSAKVHVWGTGGSKLTQFFRLLYTGNKIIHNSRFIIQDSLITTQDPFFTGLAGLLLKRKETTFETQVHGDFYGSDYYQKSGLTNKIRFYIGKFLLPRADKVRTVSERVKQSLIKIGVKSEKIEIKPIQVDFEKIKNYQPKFDLHQKYPDYEKIFLVLGRFDAVKNIRWLIEVFCEVVKQKNYLLLIIGSGPDGHNITTHATRCMLRKNIKFEPWTNDPISYIKTADCLLFPSLSEGYGLAAMEASAAGTQVIMTDVGVANYELKLGPKVKIAPVGDKEKFIQEILQI
ncbi:MAG: glycosyltransferase family 4 protein [Patescibacteria group bacterium]|nr:glycosyltransferase family 4 protein [Patescibacteria group bacterium]